MHNIVKHRKNYIIHITSIWWQRALNFLNNDGNLRHNNVNLWTVFVNEESGEWKLGGVEYMTAVDTPYNLLPPTFQVYQPPEAKENAKPVTKW